MWRTSAGVADRRGGAARAAEEKPGSSSVWEVDVAELGDDRWLGAGSREVALGWRTGGGTVAGAAKRRGLAAEDHALHHTVDLVSPSRRWAPRGIQEAVRPSGLELRRKAHARDRFAGHQLWLKPTGACRVRDTALSERGGRGLETVNLLRGIRPGQSPKGVYHLRDRLASCANSHLMAMWTLTLAADTLSPNVHGRGSRVTPSRILEATPILRRYQCPQGGGCA